MNFVKISLIRKEIRGGIGALKGVGALIEALLLSALDFFYWVLGTSRLILFFSEVD